MIERLRCFFIMTFSFGDEVGVKILMKWVLVNKYLLLKGNGIFKNGVRMEFFFCTKGCLGMRRGYFRGRVCVSILDFLGFLVY